ncbi:MAG: hypothetical protein ACRC2T_01740 [Thermoguttaceae bacterium]
MNKIYSRLLISFIVVAIIVPAVGCSKAIKIKGKVTYPDGTPVTHGCVTFECGNQAVLGMLDSSGNYKLGRFKEGDGVMPGVYSVWLTGTNKTETNVDMSAGMPRSSSITTATVHPKYTQKETSELTFEVKPGGPKTFDFTVEPPEIEVLNVM